MNGYREWFQDQARDLVMWGIGKAEETSGIPLWNNVINSASHDIKEYITEQFETEFLQRHPEAIEYPEVVNMSHEIMYPTEKKTLQEFWTGWENNLERAKENRSWFHDEMAKKPYEAPRWQEPTKAVDAIDFNITRPEVPDKHKAHPLVYGEEYIDTAKPVTIESEDPERINFSAEPRPTPDTPKDVALDKDSIHIVKKGDVLSKIAKKYGVSVNDIIKENDIKNRNQIYPNQKIIIPRSISKILVEDKDAKELAGEEAVEAVEKLVEEKLGRKLKPVEKKIVSYEGFVDGIYKDPKQNKSINAWGVGQTGKYMTKDGDKYTIDGFLNKVNEAIGWAEDTFPNWANLSVELKNEIIASYYRGGINKWPNTKKHIIDGNWGEAFKEILNNDEYRKTKLGGVIKRFNNFFSALINENTKK